jgi:hypothetical protein
VKRKADRTATPSKRCRSTAVPVWHSPPAIITYFCFALYLDLRFTAGARDVWEILLGA